MMSAKDYFNFSKGEQNAIIIFIIIISIVILLPKSNKKYKNFTSFAADSSFIEEAKQFLQNTEINHNSDNNFDFYNTNKSTKLSKFKPFKFDPNTAKLNDWIRLGFSQKQSESIVKFFEKGGRVRVKEDLKKIFFVNDEIYTVLEPYITISNLTDNTIKESKVFDRVDNSNKKIEINTADSVQLCKIKGIGATFSRRIIKYRKLLGGFVDIQQLKEVYGIDSIMFSFIKEQIIIDTAKIVKINVNTMSLSELKKHPYLDYYTAKAIVDKRVQINKFTSFEEIQDIKIIHKRIFDKIRLYLEL